MTNQNTKPRRSWTAEQIRAVVFDLAATMAGMPLEKMEPATRFIEDLEFDSLDIADFTMRLEETLDIRIPEGPHAPSPGTLGETIHLVKNVLRSRIVADERPT